MLRVLKLLSDGEFHSGEDLGKKLNLSRSAVWKLVKLIQNLDIELETRTGKGYRIPNGITLLDAKLIQNHIENPELEKLASIEIAESLSSTMDYFNPIADNSDPIPIISSYTNDLYKTHNTHNTSSPLIFAANRACFAERQTKGRGRLGRKWSSPFAKNIYLSLLWHFPKELCELSGLSLAIATAIIKTLNKFDINNQDLGLKWPNDVLYQNQKLAGILIELNGESHNVSRAVIGVGLNILTANGTSKYSHNLHNLHNLHNPHIFHNSHPHNIDQPWTTVQSILGAIPDRNHVSGILLNELIKTCLLFAKEGLSPFIDYWRSKDLTFNKPVKILCQGQEIKGIGQGINEQGHFILETEQNEKRIFTNGEVSLRLI